MPERIASVESVSDVAGERCFLVAADDGQRYQLPEDQLRWVGRLVFTSLARTKRINPFAVSGAPVSLVIAQKAGGVRVSCERCGRPQSAWLFRTRQNEVEDVYFTRCSRCWRSRFLGRFDRLPVEPSPTPARPVTSWPAGTLSTKGAALVTLVLIVVIVGAILFVNLHHSGYSGPIGRPLP
jgi:hypothetical protein